MVRVEPFVFQMVTAFKERIQMVSKINEIIELVNQDVGADEVRAIVTEMLGDYYDKETIDEMFDSIDFTPYYTKTEVNAIVDRIDGDVDAVEDRMDDAETELDNLGGRMSTAEGDIDALEAGKQNVLTPVSPIQIVTEDSVEKLKLKGFEFFNSVNWFSELFDVDTSVQYPEYYFKYDTILCIHGMGHIQSTPIAFFPKGMRFLFNNTYNIPLFAGNYINDLGSVIFANGNSSSMSSSSYRGIQQRKAFINNTTHYTISDQWVRNNTINTIQRRTAFTYGNVASGSIYLSVMVR